MILCTRKNPKVSHPTSHDVKIVVTLGLDNSGKTTIIQRLKFGNDFHPQLTSQSNNLCHRENIEYNGTLMRIIDLKGDVQSRNYWKDYITNADAVIFVVDASSYERVDLARERLHELFFNNYVHDLPLLIFANKQDRPCPMETEELKDELDVDELLPLCKMLKIQLCTATTGKGVIEGFNWLSKILRLA